MGTQRDKILASRDIPEQVVEVPEWDCSVLVCGFSGKWFARLLEILDTSGGDEKSVARGIAEVAPEMTVSILRNPDTHELIFTPDDTDKLGEHSGAVLLRLVGIAIELTPITTSDAGTAKKD